jgi:hypothetical protein
MTVAGELFERQLPSTDQACAVGNHWALAADPALRPLIRQMYFGGKCAEEEQRQCDDF